MNKIKVLTFACALLFGATASAQFTTGGKTTGASYSNAEISSYDLFGVSYVNETFSYDFPGDDDIDNIGTNGFALKYLHGFSVSSTLPLYVETGLNLNFNFGSVDEDDYGTQKYQFAALAIPVNAAYKFNVGETVKIKPYLGLNVKFNVLGRTKFEYEDEDYDDDTKWASIYSKKDMGSKDEVWNRFQLGWHIGADVQFNQFFVGINYGTDFIKAYSYKKYKINSSTLNVGVGVYF